MLVLHLGIFKLLLFGHEIQHPCLVLLLCILKVDLLGLDELVDVVVLLELDDPVAEAFRGNGSLCDTARLELWVVKECCLNLVHDVLGDVVLVEVQQLLQEVFLDHKFLSSIPPVVFLYLGVVLFVRPLYFAIAHHADCMKDLSHSLWRVVQHPNLIDVGGLDCVERVICRLEDRHGFLQVVLAGNFDVLGHHRDLIRPFFLLLNLAFLWLDLGLRFRIELPLLDFREALRLLQPRLLVADPLLHFGHFLLLLHQLGDAGLVAELLVVEKVALLV